MTAAGGRCPSCDAPVGVADEICPSCDLPLRPPERRLVTLLFADLTGYTRLCQDLDPEDVHTTIAPLMARLRRIAESLGALVEAVQGDGFLAAWGARQARADDVGRALAAVVQMQQLVEQWRVTNPQLQVRLPGLHASIHLDEVLVAPARSTMGVSVTGDAVNVGARLCGLAGEGQVLVTTAATALAEPGLPFGEPQTYVLRGRDRPVTAVRFNWHEYGIAREPRPRRAEIPLVDRTELRAALRLLAETGGSAVLVGEPGVGKTRVITEVVGGLERWVVLRGAVPAFGAVGWIDALCSALQSISDRDVDLGELLALTPGWMPNPLVQRRLRQLLGSYPDGAETDDEDALAEAFASWWVQAAAHHPVALVIDDLHHAPVELGAFLHGLAATATAHRTLLLATARDEGDSWGGLPTISVQPLEPAEAAELIERLLPGAEASLAGALAERSGGNPLFAEEVAALLLERNAIELTDNGALLLTPEATDDIPTGLRLLVLARIDLLTPLAQQVVRAAAVLGSRFDRRLLELLLASHDVDTGLSELANRGMLEDHSTSLGEWAFRHALLRDVAYGSLARGQRVRMHITAAALSTPDNRRMPALTAAHHLHAAWECSRRSSNPGGDVELARRACAELLAVAEFLVSRRPGPARRILELAAQVTGHLPPSEAASSGLRVQVLEIEAALAEGSEHDVVDATTKLLDQPVRAEQRGELLLFRGKARWFLDQLESARGDLDEAARLLEVSRPAQAAQARAIRAFTGEGAFEEMIAEHLSGWGPAVASGDTRVQIDLATNLAVDLSVVSSTEAAHWRRVVDSLLGPEDHVGRAWLDLAASYSASYELDWQRAQAAAEGASSIGREAGNMQLYNSAELQLLETSLNLGLVEETERRLRAMRDRIALRTSPRSHLICLLIELLLSARTSGDRAACAPLLAQVNAGVNALPIGDQAFVHVYLGHTHLALGDWVQARRSSEYGLALSRERGYEPTTMNPLMTLLQVGLGEANAVEHGEALIGLAADNHSSIASRSGQRWLAQHRLVTGESGDASALGPAVTLEHRALDLELEALRGGTVESLLAAADLWDEQHWAIWKQRALVWHALATKGATATGDTADVPGPAPAELVARWRAQWDRARAAP